MADEQHDVTGSADYQAPPDPTQPASTSSPGSGGSPTADQPPAGSTDAGSSEAPNLSAPGAAASETATISKVDPPQHTEPGTVEPDSTTVQPLHVDQRTRRSDNDALEGHFVDLVDGEHEGRRGTFDRVTEYGKDGYPKRILVITRDERNEPLDVPYEYARPTKYLGGR